MTDSLIKKRDILKAVVELNITQEHLLNATEFDGDSFQKNMEEKSKCIDELNSLDEGFQIIYDRIRQDVEEYKANYMTEIIRLQELIKEVSGLSATIQSQETRNKVRAENKFRQLRQDNKTAKRSVSMVNKYYKNMSRVSQEPQFMDKKK